MGERGGGRCASDGLLKTAYTPRNSQRCAWQAPPLPPSSSRCECGTFHTARLHHRRTRVSQLATTRPRRGARAPDWALQTESPNRPETRVRWAMSATERRTAPDMINEGELVGHKESACRLRRIGRSPGPSQPAKGAAQSASLSTAQLQSPIPTIQPPSPRSIQPAHPIDPSASTAHSTRLSSIRPSRAGPPARPSHSPRVDRLTKQAQSSWG